ncbi:calcium-transporting ATPase type 2C member 2-like, partial [Hyalella azteca]|uniref:Calcium-transporting ATPase type 2C member 2-like n=1 Tax=Hyalella azteca TaxID=294128 RepID=A0A979FHP8_HYAAZ
LLCNNAQLVAGQLLGQPTEGALLVAALKTGAVEWLVKGSVEVLMEDCAQYHQGSSSLPLSPNTKAAIISTAQQHARHGLRVVCLARGSSLQSLVYQGLVGIQDPPREAVSHALDVLYSTGVNVKMVTGDAMETACAVARAVGMHVSPGGVFSGNHLDSVDDN